MTGDIREALRERNKAERLCAELVGVLLPFVEVCLKDIGDDEADSDLFQVNRNNRAPKLTVGDFRRAAALFERASEK
jgi:hypothetical protein